jgi:hypothetical protein
MVGVQQMPHSNQDTQANIESYHDVLKCWFILNTKSFRRHRIDWLVWWLTTTIARHYMHTLEMKKQGFIKKQGCGGHCYMKCGKCSPSSTHPCVPTNPWKWWSLGHTKPTPSQHHLCDEISIHWNILLHIHVNERCQGRCVNTKLWWFSHAQTLLMKI